MKNTYKNLREDPIIKTWSLLPLMVQYRFFRNWIADVISWLQTWMEITIISNRLYRMEVEAPLRCGDVLLEDIAGTGVDLVATRSLKER